jgi:multidrug efflux pump subunit AcrB
MPSGFTIMYPRDNSEFVKTSIREVIETLVIAIALVVVVMYLFLQSWRATLVPAIAVPVVLLGTFGILALFGYSINTLTLFGMVLAIGLLVDDAIVVVENVERLMADKGLRPRRPPSNRWTRSARRWWASRWCCRRCCCRWPFSAARRA